MLSKNNIKYLTALKQGKFRKQHNSFIVEGDKMVLEALQSGLYVKQLLATPEWSAACPQHLLPAELVPCSLADIKKVSSLQSPQPALVELERPMPGLDLDGFKGHLSLALDCVQDPGNLGTIIRIANWFGITDLLCSPDTADAFNPKVVQATMGAIFRVKVHYLPLAAALQELKAGGLPVYGAILGGSDLYGASLQQQGVLVMGNESKGISGELAALVDKALMIPSYAKNEGEAMESLNVATATAILCAEFRRRK